MSNKIKITAKNRENFDKMLSLVDSMNVSFKSQIESIEKGFGTTITLNKKFETKAEIYLPDSVSKITMKNNTVNANTFSGVEIVSKFDNAESVSIILIKDFKI